MKDLITNIFAAITFVAFLAAVISIFIPLKMGFWLKDKSNIKLLRIKVPAIYIIIMSVNIVVSAAFIDVPEAPIEEATQQAGKPQPKEEHKTTIPSSQPKEQVKTNNNNRYSLHQRDSINRINALKKQLNPDGSHITISKYIKSRLTDPKSFVHLNLAQYDVGDYIIIISDYMGDGYVKKNRAKVDLKGVIIEVESDMIIR